MELAIRYSSDQQSPLLTRGLHSTDAGCRRLATAVLALLDTRWSRRQLLEVLTELDDRDATLECRLALRESLNSDARRAVDEWELQHPDATQAVSSGTGLSSAAAVCSRE